MRHLTLILVVCLLAVAGATTVDTVRAGEPTGEIGPMNPTMFKCVDRDGKELIQPDPFRKPTVRVFVRGGEEYGLQTIEDFLAENPDARESICTSDLQIDFGFDTKEAEQFNAYLEELEDECEDESEFARIVPIRDTRIEGFVYEFHPRNPEDPENSDWFAVPSKNVPVLAKGITFEIFWNSDDNGSFYFDNLGAGPILLNLQLPPDAHMINPNIYLDSTGLEETQRTDLGFYRGDVGPPDPEILVTSDGRPLPFLGFGDIENLSMCGYSDLPAVAASLSPPETDSPDEPGMPNVGGVRSQETAVSIIALSLLLVILLPTAGFVTLRRTRRAETG